MIIRYPGPVEVADAITIDPINGNDQNPTSAPLKTAREASRRLRGATVTDSVIVTVLSDLPLSDRFELSGIELEDDGAVDIVSSDANNQSGVAAITAVVAISEGYFQLTTSGYNWEGTPERAIALSNYPGRGFIERVIDPDTILVTGFSGYEPTVGASLDITPLTTMSAPLLDVMPLEGSGGPPLLKNPRVSVVGFALTSDEIGLDLLRGAEFFHCSIPMPAGETTVFPPGCLLRDCAIGETSSLRGESLSLLGCFVEGESSASKLRVEGKVNFQNCTFASAGLRATAGAFCLLTGGNRFVDVDTAVVVEAGGIVQSLTGTLTSHNLSGYGARLLSGGRWFFEDGHLPALIGAAGEVLVGPTPHSWGAVSEPTFDAAVVAQVSA